MVDFFASLEKMGDLSGKNTLPGFLSTHPLTKERIQNVKGMIIPSDDRLLKKRPDYLNRIDNIVYGDDPRQGYVEDNSFYHPQMHFYFTFPSNWKAQNTPTQVTLSSNDGNAALILQAEKSAENLASYSERKASSIDGRTLITERDFTANSLSGYVRLYDIAQANKAKLRLQLSVIRKAPYIYTFSALSTAADFTNYDPAFQKIVRSFNELHDPGHLNRQPLRLKFFKADGTETLESIFRDENVKKDFRPQLAILNGLELNSLPEKNQLVKIIR
jgi:predicted Zn-dependent protease